MTKKVMIANYDPNVLKEQKKAFEGMDVELKTVRNGSSALEEFGNFKPDMVLLDPMLPRISGFDVAQKIRETMPNLPIIMLTAVYKGLVYRTQALDKYGATEYLEEPISVNKLRGIIGKYIGLPAKQKKHRVSSKKRFEKLVQDTKDNTKLDKQKKRPKKARVSVKQETVDEAPGTQKKSGGKHKSTRKKLESIVKDNNLH